MSAERCTGPITKLTTASAGPWGERWEVANDDRSKFYTVSRASAKQEAGWGCSCPHWKFRRATCKHIEHVQAQLAREAIAAAADFPADRHGR